MKSLKPTKMLFESPKVGSRVGAVLSADDDVVRLLGYGVRVEDSVPSSSVMGAVSTDARNKQMKVPCLRLDDGGHVWGTECFWAPEQSVKTWIGERRVLLVSPRRSMSH